MSGQCLSGERAPVTLSWALQNVRTAGAQRPNPPAESMCQQTLAGVGEGRERGQTPGVWHTRPLPTLQPGGGRGKS